MVAAAEITGKRFGRLVAVERVANTPRGIARWLFQCDCGATKEVVAHDVTSGHSRSCGCAALEGRVTHAQAGTRLYRTWDGMIGRCTRPTSAGYKNYGCRGISVDPAWLKFQAFFDWASASGYQDHLEIDRVDVDGPYCPSNCRWVTSRENSRNRRGSLFVEYRGERLALNDFTDRFGGGMNYNKMRYRITKLKMTPQEALDYRRGT